MTSLIIGMQYGLQEKCMPHCCPKLCSFCFSADTVSNVEYFARVERPEDFSRQTEIPMLSARQRTQPFHRLLHHLCVLSSSQLVLTFDQASSPKRLAHTLSRFAESLLPLRYSANRTVLPSAFRTT